MATAKLAASSLMDVVTSTSGAIISTANTISATVGWAESAMNHIRVKQADAHKVELIDYRENLMDESALAVAKREEKLRTQIGDNTKMQDSFNKHRAKLEKALGIDQE